MHVCGELSTTSGFHWQDMSIIEQWKETDDDSLVRDFILAAVKLEVNTLFLVISAILGCVLEHRTS